MIECTERKKVSFTLVLVGIVAISFLTGCAAHRFPVIKSVDVTSETERLNRAHDFFIQARDYERQGMFQIAERFYEMAYEYDPESEFLRKTLLSRYLGSKNFAKALILIKGERQLSDLDNEEKRQLASVYLGMEEMAKAAEVLELIEEKTEEEIYSLGLVYESMGQKERAYKKFGEFFAGNPNSVGIGVKLVQFNIAEKRFAEAESLSTMLLRNFPESPEVLSVTGTLEYLTRDTTRALKLYNAALEIDSLNEESLRSIAHIHIVRGQYPEAIAVYKKLVASEEIGAVYRRGLAFLLFHDKQFEEAEKMLDELVEEKPEDSELHYYRALIYSETDRHEEASSGFESALELDSLNEELWREY
ncbi:MAG: tetratricopeptide repeat protein [Fibrobacterota bacterium]